MKKILVLMSLMYSVLEGVLLWIIQTVNYVDLDKFMGDWYVIAGRVTFLEKDAYNPIESYRWNSKKRVDIDFHFNSGSFTGKKNQFLRRLIFTIKVQMLTGK